MVNIAFLLETNTPKHSLHTHTTHTRRDKVSDRYDTKRYVVRQTLRLARESEINCIWEIRIERAPAKRTLLNIVVATRPRVCNSVVLLNLCVFKFLSVCAWLRRSVGASDKWVTRRNSNVEDFIKLFKFWSYFRFHSKYWKNSKTFFKLKVFEFEFQRN